MTITAIQPMSRRDGYDLRKRSPLAEIPAFRLRFFCRSQAELGNEGTRRVSEGQSQPLL